MDILASYHLNDVEYEYSWTLMVCYAPCTQKMSKRRQKQILIAKKLRDSILNNGFAYTQKLRDHN